MSDTLKTQVGGDHYREMKIQPTEFIHANGMGFIEGCAIKYICRHKRKNGKQDLEKAIHYLQMLIAMEYPERPQTPEAVADHKEDSDEWIPWDGGECPVDPDTEILLRFRDGAESTFIDVAEGHRWTHHNNGGDIIAYKIARPLT